MPDLSTDAMKEIVNDFCDESTKLFAQMQACLEILETNPANTGELEKFGQIIDRVMGAAKSIGAEELATFCELGKTIGYKSSQTKDLPLLNVVIAILFDTTDLLNKMLTQLRTGTKDSLKGLSTTAFASRLRWLSDKFKNIERGSCAIESNQLSQKSIDDLMASLGL